LGSQQEARSEENAVAAIGEPKPAIAAEADTKAQLDPLEAFSTRLDAPPVQPSTSASGPRKRKPKKEDWMTNATQQH